MTRRFFDVDFIQNDDHDEDAERWTVIPPTESGTADPIGKEYGYATLAEAVAVVESWAAQRYLHLPYIVTITVGQEVSDDA